MKYQDIWQPPTFENPLVEKARVFATAVHAAWAHQRKYSNEPYIVHPIECVGILQVLLREGRRISTAQQIAMLCHDTIEDTRRFRDHTGFVDASSKSARSGEAGLVPGITREIIEAEFNPEAARITDGLTDVSMPWQGNRAERKALDLAHTAAQDGDVQTCKLADFLSNERSMTQHAPEGFAHKWMREKAAMVAVCGRADPDLLAFANERLAAFGL